MRIPTSDFPLYFTKVRLSRKPKVRCLIQTLLPKHKSERLHTGHRLVWSLFTETGTEPRDFLWREADQGEFYILSERKPTTEHEFFDISQPKPFVPCLAVGDQIAFSLRANPTKTLRSVGDSKSRGKVVDVVMHRKYNLRASLKTGEKLPDRSEIEQDAVLSWFEGQGKNHGFCSSEHNLKLEGDSTTKKKLIRISGYQTIRFNRGKNQVRFSKADIDGVLTVTDPVKFLSALVNGFGRAKSYGCGLMLIRRA